MLDCEAGKSFWRQVDKRGSYDCWEWKGFKNSKGYGMFLGNGAHRVAYESHYKYQIPEDMLVCHKCDNPACCNPLHLYIGTYVDNMRDRMSRRNCNLYSNESPFSLARFNPNTIMPSDDEVEDLTNLFGIN